MGRISNLLRWYNENILRILKKAASIKTGSKEYEELLRQAEEQLAESEQLHQDVKKFSGC